MWIKKEQPEAILWFRFKCPVGLKEMPAGAVLGVWRAASVIIISSGFKTQPRSWFKSRRLTHCQKFGFVSYGLGPGKLHFSILFLSILILKFRISHTSTIFTPETYRGETLMPSLSPGDVCPVFWNMGSSLFSILTIVAFCGHWKRYSGILKIVL